MFLLEFALMKTPNRESRHMTNNNKFLTPNRESKCMANNNNFC